MFRLKNNPVLISYQTKILKTFFASSANLIAEATKMEHFPKTLKPFNKDEMIDFYLKLSQKMLKEIKPSSL